MSQIRMPDGPTVLEGGVLGRRDRMNTENLMKEIDPQQFADIFAHEQEDWFAEPEFAGQYVDACVQYYRRLGEQLFLDRAAIVVDSMVANQRSDGYLGTYRAGLEFGETFSVWNQTFVIKGLVSYYEATGSEPALNAAARCADYIAERYLGDDPPDILRTINQGLQHTSILQQIVRLYGVTKKKLYLRFAEYIISRWEETTIKFVTAPNEFQFPLFEIGAVKAVESLICYHGILELYQITGEKRYLTAAARYWEAVKRQQINVIGCGALTELWVLGGNRPANLPIDVHPNETCVSWGWAKLSLMLFALTGEGKYFDAIEQTLYNHVMGAQAIDGSDFSYYQGLVGRKVHEKHPGQYSCCRYRGLHFYAYVADHVFAYDERRAFVNLYTPANARVLGDRVGLRCQTEYPRDGVIRVTVDCANAQEFTLCLRIPGWCQSHSVAVDGEPADAAVTDGYLVLEREWSAGSTTVELQLTMSTGAIRANVDHVPSAAITYGPLTLAIDSRYGTPIHHTNVTLPGEEPALTPIEVSDLAGASEAGPIVAFTSSGSINNESAEVTLVDYASAGSLAANHDEFKVWLPLTEGV